MNWLKKRWPLLLLIFIPMWIIAVVGEILDSRLLENEGQVFQGRITSAEWFSTGRGGRRVHLNVTWHMPDGKDYSKVFKLPSAQGIEYADNDNRILLDQIEVRSAPSKPDVARLVITPADPWWAGIILACVGFCVLCGIAWYLSINGFWVKKR